MTKLRQGSEIDISTMSHLLCPLLGFLGEKNAFCLNIMTLIGFSMTPCSLPFNKEFVSVYPFLNATFHTVSSSCLLFLHYVGYSLELNYAIYFCVFMVSFDHSKLHEASDFLHLVCCDFPSI